MAPGKAGLFRLAQVQVCLLAIAASLFLLLICPDGTPPISLENVERRINPNTASVGSLLRLPMIGPKRAQAIVDYREQVYAETGEREVFKGPGDLGAIKGIGPGIVRQVRPYLTFEPELSRFVP